MSDQTPISNSEGPQATASEHRHRNAWVPGVILIVLGLVFLLNNLSGFELHNWWALFILIPAFSAFRRAWERYNRAGLVNRKVRHALFSGLLLTALTAVFLFNLSWLLFGPVLLILLGLTLLGNEILP